MLLCVNPRFHPQAVSEILRAVGEDELGAAVAGGKRKLLGEGNICDDEASCSCTGTVFFGRKFVSGKPGSGATTSLDQLKTTGYKEKQATGSVECSSAAMGGDPLRGYYKYCICQHDTFDSASATSLNVALEGNTPSESETELATKENEAKISNTALKQQLNDLQHTNRALTEDLSKVQANNAASVAKIQVMADQLKTASECAAKAETVAFDSASATSVNVTPEEPSLEEQVAVASGATSSTISIALGSMTVGNTKMCLGQHPDACPVANGKQHYMSLPASIRKLDNSPSAEHIVQCPGDGNEDTGAAQCADSQISTLRQPAADLTSANGGGLK